MAHIYIPHNRALPCGIGGLCRGKAYIALVGFRFAVACLPSQQLYYTTSHWVCQPLFLLFFKKSLARPIRKNRKGGLFRASLKEILRMCSTSSRGLTAALAGLRLTALRIFWTYCCIKTDCLVLLLSFRSPSCGFKNPLIGMPFGFTGFTTAILKGDFLFDCDNIIADFFVFVNRFWQKNKKKFFSKTY